MTQARTGQAERSILPATAAGNGLGSLSIGSAQSRAAARSLLTARQECEAEGEWERERDASGLAERLDAARRRSECGEVDTVDWSPIYIPPGKENTVRGRLAARLNSARARLASFDRERKAGE